MWVRARLPWLLFLVFSFPGQQAASQDIPCVLTSWVGEEPPHLYIDKNTGEAEGPDAALLRDAAASLGCTVQFLNLPWKRAVQSLKTGGLDIIPYAKFTNDRAVFAHYSLPYRDFLHQLYVPNDAPQSHRTLAGLLADKGRLGLMKGYRYPQEVDRLIKNPAHQDQIVYVSEYSQLLHLAHKRRIHGFLASDNVVSSIGPDLGYDTAFFAAGDAFPEQFHFMYSKQTVTISQMRKMDLMIQVRLDSGDFEELY